jgi:hypothetical protein
VLVHVGRHGPFILNVSVVFFKAASTREKNQQQIWTNECYIWHISVSWVSNMIWTTSFQSLRVGDQMRSKKGKLSYPNVSFLVFYVSAVPDRFSKDPDQVLRSPRIANYRPSPDLLEKVVKYLCAVLGKRRDAVAKHIPKTMPMWTKMRLRHGGDVIRTASWLRKRTLTIQDQRNNSYVRVSTHQ